MKRLIVLLACSSALAVVVAGCGGGGGGGGGDRLSKEDYQQSAQAIGQKLQDRFGDFTDVDPSDIGSLGDLMSKLADGLDAAADEFAELNPPEEVQAAQDKFVAGAHELADDARAIADKLENATLADVASLQDELDISKSDAFAKLQEAADEFKEKGYDFGELGG